MVSKNSTLSLQTSCKRGNEVVVKFLNIFPIAYKNSSIYPAMVFRPIVTSNITLIYFRYMSVTILKHNYFNLRNLGVIGN